MRPSPAGDLPPVALIAGPTASGKSALALALADRIDAAGFEPVILNADSMQVYRDIPIVSAAPNAQERGRHRHELYGVWDGATPCSAPEWAERAKAIIAESPADMVIPILVGGTGMYLSVLLEGIAPIPEIDADIRADVRAHPVADAFAALQIEDPEAARRLRPKDGQRIARALEVVRSTGMPLHHWFARRSGGIGDRIDLYPLLFIPERDLLRRRSAMRFVQMLDQGAVQEVEALLTRELDPALPVMRAIGVPEIAALVRGEITREQATELGQIATRRYAKRQSTWFRRQPPDWWPIAATEGEALSAFDPLLEHLREERS